MAICWLLQFPDYWLFEQHNVLKHDIRLWEPGRIIKFYLLLLNTDSIFLNTFVEMKIVADVVIDVISRRRAEEEYVEYKKEYRGSFENECLCFTSHIFVRNKTLDWII